MDTNNGYRAEGLEGGEQGMCVCVRERKSDSCGQRKWNMLWASLCLEYFILEHIHKRVTSSDPRREEEDVESNSDSIRKFYEFPFASHNDKYNQMDLNPFERIFTTQFA